MPNNNILIINLIPPLRPTRKISIELGIRERRNRGRGKRLICIVSCSVELRVRVRGYPEGVQGVFGAETVVGFRGGEEHLFVRGVDCIYFLISMSSDCEDLMC